jgi:uncharacterized membrane protein
MEVPMEDTTLPAGVQPRTVDVGHGFSWWSEAWTLFMRNPLMWILMAVILIVITVVLQLVPFLGWLAASLLTPVFFAGWLLAARKVETGGTLEVSDLFLGFKEQSTPLLVLGAIFLVCTLVIFAVGAAFGFGAITGLMFGGASQSTGGVMAAAGAAMLVLLVVLVLSVLVAMAMWFAPALVVFRNLAPIDAMKISFAANLKNIGAFLVYGVLYFIAAIVASIPLGLGWLVLVPLVLLTSYVSYRDVFDAPAA